METQFEPSVAIVQPGSCFPHNRRGPPKPFLMAVLKTDLPPVALQSRGDKQSGRKDCITAVCPHLRPHRPPHFTAGACLPAPISVWSTSTLNVFATISPPCCVVLVPGSFSCTFMGRQCVNIGVMNDYTSHFCVPKFTSPRVFTHENARSFAAKCIPCVVSTVGRLCEGMISMNH